MGHASIERCERMQGFGGFKVPLAEGADDVPVAPLVDALLVEHVKAGEEA